MNQRRALHERAHSSFCSCSSYAIVMLKSQIPFKTKTFDESIWEEDFFVSFRFVSFMLAFHHILSFYSLWFCFVFLFFCFSSIYVRRWLCSTSCIWSYDSFSSIELDIKMKNKTQLHRAHKITPKHRKGNGIAWSLFYLWLRCGAMRNWNDSAK